MTWLFDTLSQIDTWLFYAINHGLSNGLFDTVMPIFTSVTWWRPIYAIALVLLLWKGGVRGRWAAATLVVMIAVFDPLSTLLLKNPIDRLRPFNVLPDAINLIGMVGNGAGSFPSNHALNNTAAAVILHHYYPQRTWLWVAIAALMGVSRIYVGVHWPSDVLGGAVLGMVGGYGMVMLVRLIQQRSPLPRPDDHSERHPRA